VQNKPRPSQVSSDRPCGRRARDLRLTNARELVILRVPLKLFQRASFPSYILIFRERGRTHGERRQARQHQTAKLGELALLFHDEKQAKHQRATDLEEV
jgi:hypothetical protein